MQSILTFILTMPIVSIAGNPTIVEFSISTHHITVIRHNKMTSSIRTSESERTPLIQRMKGKHNRVEICCLCVENGKATHNGQCSLLSLTGTGIVLMRESEELAIQLLI